MNLLFDEALEIDEAGLRQRGSEAILADEQVRLWLRDNRLSLHRGATSRQYLDDTLRQAVAIPLCCVAHAHPACQFRWVRLVVDLSTVPEVKIHDMSPKEVRGEEPVKITTKHTAGLSFELEKFKLGPDASVEKGSEHEVYFPELTSSGIGLQIAHWNFEALPGEDLRVDRDLHLLVAVPSKLLQLEARFTLRARVALEGVAGLVPLVGRREVVVEMSEAL